MRMALNFPVVQIAYFTSDARRSALDAAARFGAGPFFLVERIPLAWGELRGRAGTFVHTSAYGQWGEVMLEFVQQDEEGPSPFRDMYAPGETGIHHVAMMVDSLADSYTEVSVQGLTIAARAQTVTGTEFAFIDTVAELGHMVEIYERTPALEGFYAHVRAASVGWDGVDPVRGLD